MSNEQSVETQVTRRTVVRTGVKLAYATPILAASFHLAGRGALAVCDCSSITGAVYDESPYGGSGVASCCTCEHCKAARPWQGGRFGSVIYPQAYYLPGVNLCADPSLGFPNGFSTSYCPPICTPCGPFSP
jgi:hypothetical protein